MNAASLRLIRKPLSRAVSSHFSAVERRVASRARKDTEEVSSCAGRVGYSRSRSITQELLYGHGNVGVGLWLCCYAMIMGLFIVRRWQ